MLETAVNTDITYEYPLNEGIRLCLRLENLFQYVEHNKHTHTALETKNAMVGLLKLIELTERPDIKSKLSHLLTQYSNTLSQFRDHLKIDSDRLHAILHSFSSLQSDLHRSDNPFNNSLRKNEFLYHIRSDLSTPGGLADFKTPDYFLWQQQPAEKKSIDLAQWMKTFDVLKNITHTILQFARESSEFEEVVADKGFYYRTFNTALSYQLARITLPLRHNLFPEISAGKHRVTIRFMQPNYFGNGRPVQSKEAVGFQICCARI